MSTRTKAGFFGQLSLPCGADQTQTMSSLCPLGTQDLTEFNAGIVLQSNWEKLEESSGYIIEQQRKMWRQNTIYNIIHNVNKI
jgi:hypothetical protein